MKKGKRILSVFLVVVMLLTAVPFTGFTKTEAEAVNDSSISVGDEIYFGNYPKNAIKDGNGNVTEFSTEPIKWNVLKIENGKALLLSSDIIDAHFYNHTSATINGIYANNYEHSDIRHWLINDFYDTAFNSTEKEAIVETLIDNSACRTDVGASGSYTQYSSNPTLDKVFLLSKDEADNYAGRYLSKTPTDYARYNLFQQISSTELCNGWLLRTAGNNYYQIYYVQVRWGNWTTYYNWYDDAINVKMGVCPAVWIDLDEYEAGSTTIDNFTSTLNSSTYSPELAYELAKLSEAVYSETDIKKAYSSLGFDNCEVYDYYGTFDPHRAGYAMDFKKSANKEEYICLIAVRGTNNFSDGVADADLFTSVDDKHLGFEYPAHYIYNNIVNYIQNNKITGNIKFVLTGHSRGAAVANLLAVKLMENGVNASNIYDYNFACPDVACKYKFPNYNNIFNLCNRRDPVPFLPGTFASTFTTVGTSWGKFGQTYWFTKNAEPETVNPIANHSMRNVYLEFFKQKLNPSEWSTTFGEKLDSAIRDTSHWLNGWITKILCPVDVLITDVDGNNIASVIKGEINYYDSNIGDVIILTDGDKKVIYIDGEKDFNVNLIGTDNGEMTYSIEKYNVLSEEVLESKTFSEVKLEDGKTMYSPVSEAATTDDVKLYVTEDKDGQNTYTHIVDEDGTESEVIVSEEHIYRIETTKPTCTEPGYTTYTCTVCGDTQQKEIPATGHQDTYGTKGVGATCTEDGLTPGTFCRDCNTFIKGHEVVPALGHKEVVYSEMVPPTCTADGHTAETRCKTCGEVMIKSKVIPAIGHSDKNNDGFCDNCGTDLGTHNPEDNCSHICHKTGFAGFIWKILNLFNKMFKTNKVCECGAKHY